MMAAIIAFVKGFLSKTDEEISTLSDQIRNKLQLLPISGTTDESGNLEVGSGKIYIAAVHINNYIGMPFYYGSSDKTFIKLINIGTTYDAASNVSVSGYYYKIN